MNIGNKMKIILLLVLAFCASVLAKEKVIYCYYGTWATYRFELGKFDTEDIKPELCTHLVYAFMGIDYDGYIISLDPTLDLADNAGRDNLRKFNDLKQKNPKLKTILAVGGWNEGSYKYSLMAASQDLRRNFINTSLAMITEYGFDGLDLDWEYPARRDTANGVADIENFTLLLKELRAEFDKHSLMLTAAVAAVADAAVLSYNIPEISKYLDYIGLMTYDMYGAWDPVTGHNSPLHKGEGDDDTPRENLYTLDVAMEYWLTQGCPAEKLLIGVPFYGRTFTLTNANESYVRAPSAGPGISGPYTATSGYLGYNEFCVKLQSESWDIHYDTLAKVPYAVLDKNWVSYDDENSITEKIKYSQKSNVGGVIIWSIETDDFHGLCGQDFPLLKAVNTALGIEVTSPTTTVSTSESTASSTTAEPTVSSTISESTISTSTTSTPTTTESTSSSITINPTASVPTKSTASIITSTIDSTMPSNDICKEEGVTNNPQNCATFIICVKQPDDSFKANLFQCPGSLLFDQVNLVCNYPQFVDCHVAETVDITSVI